MLESAPQSSAQAATPPVVLELRPYSKRQQLLRELMNDGELLLKNRLEVRHLMTRDPVAVSPAATLEEMAALMRERRFRHLLVCGHGKELLGVISDRDLRPARGATAQQLMTFPALTCVPETPLSAAITYLMNHNISCLPVMEQGRPCGILTTTDLVLTLQCTLQLWLRLAQFFQHDPGWVRQLEKIGNSLEGTRNAGDLAERITAAHVAIQEEIQKLINLVDLRADALTGMANRRELEEILELLLAVKKRYQRPFSLVIVVVDYYQRIRETCGDDVVKPLLKEVAKVVEHEVRASDFAARLREDAFAVVLTETNLEQARIFCGRLQESARKSSQLKIDLRIRVGAVEAAQDDNLALLLERAEATLGL